MWMLPKVIYDSKTGVTLFPLYGKTNIRFDTPGEEGGGLDNKITHYDTLQPSSHVERVTLSSKH